MGIKLTLVKIYLNLKMIYDQIVPAHIHPIIKESGKIEYYIDDYLFDDDLRLTAAKKNKLENRGGSGIIHLTKNKAGDWIGFRDITLGSNIPNYK